EATLGRIATVIKYREIDDIRCRHGFGPTASKIADRTKAALVQDMGRMGRNNDLTGIMCAIVAFELQDAHDFANEDLLQLRMKMRLRLLDENKMDWRPIVF